MYLIVSGMVINGFFAGSVTALAWNRVRAWKHMPVEQFNEDFAETIRVADKLQPALLGVAFVFTSWFAILSHGTSQILASAAALSQSIILALSALVLVPLQRQLIASIGDDKTEAKALLDMRERWYAGHIPSFLRRLLGLSYSSGISESFSLTGTVFLVKECERNPDRVSRY